MATRIYGVSQGEEQAAYVTEGVGSAVSADTVELTVDLADGMTKAEVIRAVERILEHITKNQWAPA